MATRKTVDKKAQLYHYNYNLSKEWYVGFRRTHPLTNQRKAFQVRLGINFNNTVSERKAEGKAVIEIVNNALENLWDPFAESLEKFIEKSRFNEKQLKELEDRNAAEEAERTAFIKVLWEALENKKKDLAPKSYVDVRGVIRFAEQAAIDLKINNDPISSITKGVAKRLMIQIAENRQKVYDSQGKGKKFTGNAYNKYVEYMRLVFSEIEDLEYIEYNPFSKLKSKKEFKTYIHRHATKAEKDLIVETIKKDNIFFYYFLCTEHGCGLRPSEILSAKINSINRMNRCFEFEAEDPDTKTKVFRRSPIPNYLFEYLVTITEGYPKDYYIFGPNFKPNSKRRTRYYATREWKRIVKDGLGINVSLYSFKGMGGEDKRKAGVGAGSVSAGYGHSSMNMTKIYLHGEQDRINEDLIEKTPAL